MQSQGPALFYLYQIMEKRMVGIPCLTLTFFIFQMLNQDPVLRSYSLAQLKPRRTIIDLKEAVPRGEKVEKRKSTVKNPLFLFFRFGTRSVWQKNSVNFFFAFFRVDNLSHLSLFLQKWVNLLTCLLLFWTS